MRPRSRSILRYAAPLRAVAQRFAFLALVALTMALVVLGKADAVLVERLRVAVTDAFAPILAALAEPVATVESAIADARELGNLREDYQRLKRENIRLKQWEQVARELAAQNKSYRDALHFVPDGARHSVAVRVIADSGGPFVRSLLVNAGARDGVARGQAAMVDEGLIGRVGDVGELSARILLITDLNSRIPVIVEQTRDHAMLAGDNSDRPRLLYLPPSLQLTPGDRIVTSGMGGIFPQGLPVGVVASVSDGGVRVQPYADWNRIEFVRIIDYNLKGILEPEAPQARGGAGKP